MKRREREALHGLAEHLRRLRAGIREERNRKQQLRLQKVADGLVVAFGRELADILDWVAGSYDQQALDRAVGEIDDIFYLPRAALPSIWDTRRERAGGAEAPDDEYRRRALELRVRLADQLRALAQSVERNA